MHAAHNLQNTVSNTDTSSSDRAVLGAARRAAIVTIINQPTCKVKDGRRRRICDSWNCTYATARRILACKSLIPSCFFSTAFLGRPHRSFALGTSGPSAFKRGGGKRLFRYMGVYVVLGEMRKRNRAYASTPTCVRYDTAYGLNEDVHPRDDLPTVRSSRRQVMRRMRHQV
jgi:hypothetical protein